MSNKEIYKNITNKEKKKEIRLLKEEIKVKEKSLKPLKKALNYLTSLARKNKG